jgi:hypothetical protein
MADYKSLIALTELLNDAKKYVYHVLRLKKVVPVSSGFIYLNTFNEFSPLEDLRTLVLSSYITATKESFEAINTYNKEIKRLYDLEEAAMESTYLLASDGPPKPWKAGFKRDFYTKYPLIKEFHPISFKELEVFCDAYTQEHDIRYIRYLRRSIKTEGDYPIERETFKRSFSFTDFEVNAVAKWIQNIKRKIMGIPTGTEYALILTGEQGTGKSLFASMLCTALGDSVRKFNVEELSDKDVLGNCGSTAVMIFDEFRVVDKVGLEQLKRAITLTQYDYRPAYSRLTLSIKSITSFICSSNERLSDLVLDSENRRFVELLWDNRLPCKNEAVYEYYKQVNWEAFFNSIPIEQDVWSEADYAEKNRLTKENVKAEELKEFFVTHLDEIKAAMDEDLQWISTSGLLLIFNTYRVQLNLKLTYTYKLLARDMKILNCTSYYNNKTKTRGYLIGHLLEPIIEAVPYKEPSLKKDLT